MGKITVTPCDIEGLYVIEPTVFKDERGYFVETYNQNDFREAGLDMVFVQDNQSMSVKGVLRGLHYQKEFPQGKLVLSLIHILLGHPVAYAKILLQNIFNTLPSYVMGEKSLGLLGHQGEAAFPWLIYAGSAAVILTGCLLYTSRCV